MTTLTATPRAEAMKPQREVAAVATEAEVAAIAGGEVEASESHFAFSVAKTWDTQQKSARMARWQKSKKSAMMR